MKRAGFSLIIVLGSLVFLSVLIVAFLSQMGTELKSSKLYADGATARGLAQTATNIVMGELREATAGADQNGTLAWASQPGMIRTYDTSGRPVEYFKLYSDNDLITTSFDPAVAAAAIPADWDRRKATFVDLNQPISIKPSRGAAVATEILRYPIIDAGEALREVAINSQTVQTYDADGNKVPDVEGFFIDASAPIGAASNANRAPMPVKWLYVLADGQIVAPVESINGDKDRVEIAGMTKRNPVVGRVAFWTDDECSKVNVNTASEGTYWDAPKVMSTQDRKLSLNQPAQREYQRYSGHPATTSLSAVFTVPADYEPADPLPGLSLEQNWIEDLYRLAPRIQGGTNSSMQGTKSVYNSPTGLYPDSDRLFTSVEEVLFQPSRKDGFRQKNAWDKDRSISSTKDPDAQKSYFTEEILDRSRFFLTAVSRAPDVNLFNKPRVSIWPITLSRASGLPLMSPFDSLIAFCSKVNGHIFSFHRQHADSARNDLPANATALGLGRNRGLLGYLAHLTEQPIPGFGGSFLSKYGEKNRDQILTEIFDYIRSVNRSDATMTAADRFHIPSGTDNVGAGQVVPIEDTLTGTRGFGRYPTVQGAFLLFYGAQQGPIPATTSGTTKAGSQVPAGYTQVRALFFVNLFVPSYGYGGINPNVRLRVDGLQNFRWTTGVVNAATGTIARTEIAPMGFPAAPAAPTQNVVATGWNMFGTKNLGGSIDFMKFATNQTWAPNAYKLISGAALMPNQTYDPTSSLPTQFFEFEGGNVTIEVETTDSSVSPSLLRANQTVSLKFPDAKIDNLLLGDVRFPVPFLANSNVNSRNYRQATGTNAGRLTGNHRYSHITEQDVVRAIVPSTGDLRLMMPRATFVPPDSDYALFYDDIFSPHAFYFDRNKLLAHNLRTEDNQPYYGASGGRLLQLPYFNYKSEYTQNKYFMDSWHVRDSPLVPNSGANILGDWDTGIGNLMDGPYINMADEGTHGTTAHDPYFGYEGNGAGAALFSPNRMMPSPGMFGSLPTGVWDASGPSPWQTLLFCPNPLAGAGHKGFKTTTEPPDHLFLDLFHMPVVEPYAISEPLSTAGRINMNYQIVPFTYINRDTGLRAVLKSEKVIAISNDDAGNYKKPYPSKSDASFVAQNARLKIDMDQTLQQFRDRFANNKLFISPSEICEVWLVPETVNLTDINTFWNGRQLTGDNSRERPYTTIYPRLTTKSNTFTVYVRAQSLKKGRNTDPDHWIEGQDQVTGEYRGSQTIERYIDPNDSSIPDYADPKEDTPISGFYKFRIVSSKQFAP